MRDYLPHMYEVNLQYCPGPKHTHSMRKQTQISVMLTFYSGSTFNVPPHHKLQEKLEMEKTVHQA